MSSQRNNKRVWIKKSWADCPFDTCWREKYYQKLNNRKFRHGVKNIPVQELLDEFENELIPGIWDLW